MATMPSDPRDPTNPVRMLGKHLSQAHLRLKLQLIRRLRCAGGGHLVLGHEAGPALYLLERGRLDPEGMDPWQARHALLLGSGCRMPVRNPGRQALTIYAAPMRLAIGEVADPLSMLQLPATCGRQDEDSLELWRQLMKAGDETHAGNQWARPRARGLVLALLCRAIERGLAEDVLVFHPERRYPMWLHNVLSHIERHLDDPGLDVPGLAAVAKLSPSRFGARFRALLETSPKAYVIERRMRAARVLLHRGGLSIAEIAAACGYRDPFHFSTQFRRATGCAPSAWSHEHQENDQSEIKGH